jgi:hypothetical protein
VKVYNLAMAERPDWCLKANCPNYSGRCLLQEWYLKGWQSTKGRKAQKDRIAAIAVNNLQNVIAECRDRMPQEISEYNS